MFEHIQVLEALHIEVKEVKIICFGPLAAAVFANAPPLAAIAQMTTVDP